MFWFIFGMESEDFKMVFEKIKTSRGETLNELLTVIRYLIQQKVIPMTV